MAHEHPRITEETVDMYGTAQRYPSIAFVLSLIAGLIILIDGFVVALFGTAWGLAYSVGLGLTALILGALLILDGLVLISSSFGLTRFPEQHVSLGVTIIIFSLLALLLGGGYLFGSILGIVGGIVAVFWR